MTNQKSRRLRRAGRQISAPTQRREDDQNAGATRPSFLMLLGVICSAAFLLRLINVLQTIEIPTVVQLLGDAKGYFDWANRIAAGNWYGTETFYQAPCYPYTLAVLIKLLGSGVLGIRLFQSLLGAISVFFIGISARKLFSSPVGLIAATMYGTYPAAIYYDGIIQKTSLASFLLCALLAACTLLQQRKRGWQSLLIGAVLGLLVLTRENSLLWVPIVPFWILVGFSEPMRSRMKFIACYVAGLAAILLPVAARNASLGGEWSPTTFQAGPNFYIGNNLQSNGIYRPLVPGHETPMFERADAQRLAEQAEGRELSSREVSRFWAERSFEEIRQAPGQWVQLMIAKCFMVINRYEVPDVESMYVYCDYSWPLRVLAPCWHFGILCPLAVWGLVVTRQQWRELWLYYLLILVMVAAIVLFFILGRYRQPLVPLLILFAAAGLSELWRVFRNKDWRSVRLPILPACLALIACNLPVHDESTLNASSYMNLGIAAGQAGNMGVSIEALTYAVETHPELPEAHVNLGRALEITKRPRKAIICFENALKLDPNLVMVDGMLGRNYERIGDPQSALIHYQRAVQIDPTDAMSQQGLERLGQQLR